MKKTVAVISSNEHVVRRTISLIIASVLCLIAVKPFVKLMLEILENRKTFLDQPLEKIKIGEYGDCDAIGYGYIKKIVASIPDLSLFPVTRYSTYNRFPDVLFSDFRYRYGDKILIGIDLDKDATRETFISQAVLNSVETNPARSKWMFQTGLDYDLLTGFAAIKTSFFQEIYKNNYTEWKKYLDEVSNVGPIK